ncbi:hypothetical protein ACH4L5_34915 [Streptomyces sp. NPDC017405]|uniref:hypothetical protein n=1 Tax=unclassified Streptomyces TaxID=2593676 RepID=UPI0037AB1070
MHSDDKPINGQPNPSFLDLLGQTPEPPDMKDWPRPKRFAGLREAWDASWKQGGFLHERWEDVRHARFAGWHGMANWIKTVLSLASVCAFIILLDAAGDIVSAVAHRIAFWAVIDTPIRTYIAQHTGHLAVSGSAVYAFWQAAGLLGLVGGFFHSTGARITYSLWGAASIGMVWSASPADGRTVATGIAVLAWTTASVFALRGLSLRPVIHTAFQPHIDIRPEVHVPAQPAPAHDDLDKPDNVHPLQR